MKGLTFLICVVIYCSRAAYLSPCELFVEGLHSSLKSQTPTLQTLNCSVLNELAPFLKYQGSKKAEAIGFQMFCNRIFQTDSIQNFQDDSGEDLQNKTFHVFYKAIAESDYFTLGAEAVNSFPEGKWGPWIRGFWREWGMSSGYLIWRKTAPSTYEDKWKGEMFLFLHQKGVGLLRFDPTDWFYWPDKISTPTDIQQAYGWKWALGGSSLIVSMVGQIMVYKDPLKMTPETQPDLRQQSFLYPTVLQPFTLKIGSLRDGEDTEYIFSFHSEKNKNKGCLYNPENFPNDKPLEFELQDPIISSIIVKLESDEPKYKYKNFLVTCSQKGEVTLISFEDDAKKLENRVILRKQAKNEVNPPDNMLFVRRQKEFLLFLNTGAQVFWYDLSRNLDKTTDVGPWNDVGVKMGVQKMLLGIDPITEVDQLFIATKIDSRTRFFVFKLDSMKLDTSFPIDDIFEDLEVQLFSMQYVVQNSKHTKEGVPVLFLAALDRAWWRPNFLDFYRADWNFQEKRYRWTNLGYGGSAFKDIQAMSAFSFPTKNFGAQNPNQQDDLLRMGVSGFEELAYTYKNTEIIQTAPVYGQPVYVRQATANNLADWFVPGGLQYTNWCFASIAASIFNFNRRNEPGEQLTQCEAVNVRLKRNDCCNMPRIEPCWNISGRADKLLEDHYNFKRAKLENFSFARIKAEVNNNHLMTASKRGGHVLIIIGYREDPNPDSYGAEWLLFWNPTADQQNHGLTWMSFDAFARRRTRSTKDVEPSIYVLSDTLNS